MIIDSDESGRNLKGKLEKGLYENEQSKIIEIKEYVDIDNAEVEDLISYPVLKDPLAKFLKGYDSEFDDEYDEGKAIVSQIEKFCSDYDIDLTKGWKVELSKAVKKDLQKSKMKVDDLVAEKWKKIFEKLLSNN